jgi:trk system potassium uptake protein TrkA
MAKNLLSSGFVDAIELSNDVSMIELDIKKEWVGKNLLELSFRKKDSLNVIAIKEKGKININIEPSTPLNEDMKLIVIGNKNKILKLK